jgi:hypothetical protein
MNAPLPETAVPALSLTVIVISLVGGAALERCLRAVARIPARRIVMLRSDTPGVVSHARPEFEWQVVNGSVPEKRARGLEAATTEWVAIIEDTCEPAPTWHEAMIAVATAPQGVAWSGPVEISRYLAPRFMALACVEYAEFARANWTRLTIAQTAGAAWRMVRIPGLNLVYRRSAIDVRDLADGLVESDFHDEIQRRGGALCLHPDLAVTYFAPDHRNAAVRARFVHGRIYGGGVAQRISAGARLAGALKCVALPAVLTLRALRGLPSPYRRRTTAFAWIIAFSCAWASGECIGLLAGRGDAALDWT